MMAREEADRKKKMLTEDGGKIDRDGKMRGVTVPSDAQLIFLLDETDSAIKVKEGGRERREHVQQQTLTRERIRVTDATIITTVTIMQGEKKECITARISAINFSSKINLAPSRQPSPTPLFVPLDLTAVQENTRTRCSQISNNTVKIPEGDRRGEGGRVREKETDRGLSKL